jgi:hypothetical protein
LYRDPAKKMNMRKKNCLFYLLFVFCLWSPISRLDAFADRLRCTWRADPATTMVIAWDQVTGENPVVYYDNMDHGRNINAYKFSRRPDRIAAAKGMNNHFARLSGLKPYTTYYFIIKDSEGVSKRYSFRTAPDNSGQRISIIAGGDSRNHREARQEANLLVAKLQPHFVLFNGDMTSHDSSTEWIDWLNDWQRTIGADGWITPVIVARGNHEAENKTLFELFDLPHPGNYYVLGFGGDLLRIYTLNSMIPAGGDQKTWFEQDLKANASNFIWKFVQYHHAIRPHHSGKSEKDDLYLHWSPLFHQYKIQLAIESDSHVAKCTYPLRPDTGPGSDMGFIRDDHDGTVFVGEGCWGAPLRANDDDKSWTRASGSFNHFNWIFVDQEKIEVRTVMTNNAQNVGVISSQNIFEPPFGLTLWSPPTGDVVLIEKKKAALALGSNNASAAAEHADDLGGNWDLLPRLIPNPSTGRIVIQFDMPNSGDASVLLYNYQRQEMARLRFDGLGSGQQSKALEFPRLQAGKYLLLVRTERKALKRYLLEK